MNLRDALDDLRDVPAAVAGITSFEKALAQRLLEPWGISRTSFDMPDGSVGGWDGPAALPPIDYPEARRPSGGLWSNVPDLLALGEVASSDIPGRVLPRLRFDLAT
ncbi:hypothetical protein ACIA5D_08385 [Actinoplanes sp. NPDC051513]|uniref:hypothetical protein n=1 Tax=Actinoplanes sp. NPDC051513 TaxID=3363908 RepID=UPI0037AE1F6A